MAISWLEMLHTNIRSLGILSVNGEFPISQNMYLRNVCTHLVFGKSASWNWCPFLDILEKIKISKKDILRKSAFFAMRHWTKNEHLSLHSSVEITEILSHSRRAHKEFVKTMVY